MFAEEHIKQVFMNEGINGIINMIRFLEIKPCIDECINDFDYDAVIKMEEAAGNDICECQLREKVKVLAVKASTVYRKGEAGTVEDGALKATFTPGETPILEINYTPVGSYSEIE